jgi:hypothetical protein
MQTTALRTSAQVAVHCGRTHPWHIPCVLLCYWRIIALARRMTERENEDILGTARVPHEVFKFDCWWLGLG